MSPVRAASVGALPGGVPAGEAAWVRVPRPRVGWADPADLPAEPERLLDSPTYEGFPIRPLYTDADEHGEPGLPGWCAALPALVRR